MNAAFSLICTSLHKKHHVFTELTCAMTLQVGCMHTRCNGTSSTEQAMSMEMGNGSSSAPPPPSTADTALSSARSFKRLQHAGGGISKVGALPIARDFRPFLLATESTCSSILALLTSGRASPQTLTAIFPSTGDITLHDALTHRSHHYEYACLCTMFENMNVVHADLPKSFSWTPSPPTCSSTARPPWNCA
jgi:hypothetical protein